MSIGVVWYWIKAAAELIFFLVAVVACLFALQAVLNAIGSTAIW
jgi:hypothetical protein